MLNKMKLSKMVYIFGCIVLLTFLALMIIYNRTDDLMMIGLALMVSISIFAGILENPLEENISKSFQLAGVYLFIFLVIVGLILKTPSYTLAGFVFGTILSTVSMILEETDEVWVKGLVENV